MITELCASNQTRMICKDFNSGLFSLSLNHIHICTHSNVNVYNERKSSSFTVLVVTGGGSEVSLLSLQHPVCPFVPAPTPSETKENRVGTAPPRAFNPRRERWRACWCERAFKCILRVGCIKQPVYSAPQLFLIHPPRSQHSLNRVCFFCKTLHAI